jgi:hypothetical protein
MLMTPEELARSQREARTLSDAALGELLREGPDGLSLGAWDVLQNEKDRREVGELSDAALGRRLREGPDIQHPGEWDVLKREEDYRKHMRAEARPTISPSDTGALQARYPALRTVIGIYKITAIVVLVVGGAVALLGTDLVMIKIAVVIVTGVICLFQWAAAEVIQVFIDIEANTRTTSKG